MQASYWYIASGSGHWDVVVSLVGLSGSLASCGCVLGMARSENVENVRMRPRSQFEKGICYIYLLGVLLCCLVEFGSIRIVELSCAQER